MARAAEHSSQHSLQNGRRTSRLFMQDDWHPERHYHLIGKAVPGRVLFRDDEDRRYFLRKIVRDKLKRILDVYVYCLIGNHVHLVVETLHAGDVDALIAARKPRDVSAGDKAFAAGKLKYATYVGDVFRAAITAYARYYNAKYGRVGEQLFVKPTLHGLTTKHEQDGLHFSRTLAAYVGLNYVKHHLGGVSDFYFWSSLCRRLYSIVPEERLFGFFGGEEAMVRFHHRYLRRWGEAFWAFSEDDLFADATPRRVCLPDGRWQVAETKAVRRLS